MRVPNSTQDFKLKRSNFMLPLRLKCVSWTKQDDNNMILSKINKQLLRE